jgi:hypothetical protein
MGDDDLTAGEGVNEGSADSTAETAGNTGALAAASTDGRPEGEDDPAPPLDMESAESRDAAGPGQQLEAGEG